MTDANDTDKRFGDIAIEMKVISSERLHRALVVQRCIEKRTKIHMPIGKVMKEMGLLSQVQVESILEAQKQADQNLSDSGGLLENDPTQSTLALKGLELIISEDRLGAFLSPTGEPLVGMTLDMVKNFLAEQGIVEGVIVDDALAKYLNENPLPAEPFQVACGVPPVEPKPTEIRYHFDVDPLRIGTLLEDGTMDWKNRGDIPEVKAGDLLAEKVGGAPGIPGRSIFGKDIPPPRIREPQLKNGKGAERSEDRTRIIAKVDGTPKLTSDSRIVVFTLLPIDGDIGVETGNIDFDGYVEATGAVMAGYTVEAKGLRTREIQNATIKVEEDLVSDGGIYGSNIEVGGNVKASHIHNCRLTILGDLVVEKEIFGCTIEINGRCFVESGKIIACTISAKKGIQVKDVGTAAAKPSELIAGIDHKYERDIAEAKTKLAELEKREKELTAAKIDMAARLDKVATLIGQTTQEQDGYMVQKRQFEEQLNGEKAVQDEEQRTMLKDLIAELTEQTASIQKKLDAFMQQDDEIRTLLADIEKNAAAVEEETRMIQEHVTILEETQKVDPGLPIIKVSGTVYERTKISGPHKKMIVSERMHNVRITECKSDTGGKWELAISPLR